MAKQGEEEREEIRRLMAEGSFDRKTNIYLNRLLAIDEAFDEIGVDGGEIRNLAKGLVLEQI
ncbi:MAG: hypothetical protein ACFFD4_39780 [Candidatus Odinarchaeota archaeon]